MLVGGNKHQKSSSAFGRGMMRLKQGNGSSSGAGNSPALSYMTSPLAFIQAGPPQENARKRSEGHHVNEPAGEQLRSDQVTKIGQASPGEQLQEMQPSSAVNLSPDCGEDSFTQNESYPSNNANITEDFGELGKDSPKCLEGRNTPPKISMNSTPQQGFMQRSSQPTLKVSNGLQDVKVEQETCNIYGKTRLMASEDISGKESDMQEFEQGISLCGNLRTEEHSVMQSENKTPTENSSMKLTSTVLHLGSHGLGQYEEIQSSMTSTQPSSEPIKQVLKCSLCGSDKHRTRQCATFKKYAPHVKASSSDSEQENAEVSPEVVQELKTEFRFGNNIFCSKCGEKGHLIYDCPVNGPFNIFRPFNQSN